ncbi:DUF1801 domain-containing protein [Pelagibacterium luteolum]|uniref:YdhG-like domain-containing protein n=1 Tax=Pelagibacterium luteolum TaxID=440168 RepID=A0A1G7TLY6_9HYPH|nr:DUF1801 domain-containing protein [Pelagibacterium luteolum]SDG35689.1 hypothetical protein SAMN04487974_102181 [Pelagibacterium luteolum]
MTPSEKIDALIAGLDDWRGPMMTRVRDTINGADPEIVEDWKWMGSPTWYRDGLIAVGDPHKAKIKITFAQGAKLDDPKGLFNGKDTGATRRSIDIFEGDTLDEAGLADLVRTAIAFNLTALKKNVGKTKSVKS